MDDEYKILTERIFEKDCYDLSEDDYNGESCKDAIESYFDVGLLPLTCDQMNNLLECITTKFRERCTYIPAGSKIVKLQSITDGYTFYRILDVNNNVIYDYYDGDFDCYEPFLGKLKVVSVVVDKEKTLCDKLVEDGWNIDIAKDVDRVYTQTGNTFLAVSKALGDDDDLCEELYYAVKRIVP